MSASMERGHPCPHAKSFASLLPGVKRFALTRSMRARMPALRLRARRMIVHDLPTAFSLSKQQGKRTVRLVIRAFQTPTSQNERRIFAEDVDFEIRKRERAHLLARVITLLVSIKDFLPAARDAVTTHELGLRRTVVAIHVTWNVAAVPSRGLCFEDRSDCRFGFAGIV